MGVSLARISVTVVRDDDGQTRCVPETPCRRLPAHRSRSKSPGQLILEFKALPKQCYMASEPTDAYWWTDAQFLPHDDCTLFVTTGAYSPRTNYAWTSRPKVPSGRIIRYDLGYERIRGEVFTHTLMSNYPRIHTHPSGKYVGYVGVRGVTVETVCHEDVYLKQKDLRNPNYKYCEFSPSGKLLAILLVVSKRFELLLSRMDKGFAFDDLAVDLSRMFPGFKGSTAYNEHLECRWSPDSEHIAVNSSVGFLVVLDSKLNPVVNVFEEILPGISSSTAATFDYSPQSCHQVLTVGGSNRCLYLMNPETKEILMESETLSSESIDGVLFTPSGDSILVAFRDFTLMMCDSKTLEVTFRFDMRDEVSFATNLTSGPYPNVIRLSLNSTGEQLAVSTGDGFVRLWQLPVQINLQELCKRQVLSLVPLSKIKLLPLPTKIKADFLSFPLRE